MEEPIRLLHVDDDGDFADLTADALEREDDRFEVTHTRSAREGYERLAEGEFDCVASDYDMPKENGIEFLERVRENYPDLPFILFTGKGSEAVASDAIYAGVTDYLQKESGTDQFEILANRVANAVEGYRSQQTLTERNQELRIYERIFNTMEGGACLYDEEARFELVNDYIVDFFDTTREELEGRSSALIARIREENEGDPYRDLLAGERSVLEGVVAIEAPSKGESYLEYRLTPLIVDGTVQGVVAVARDVTERVERDRRLDEFASVVSHDLRNPLNVAQGRLELATEECSSPHLEHVDRAHERMADLIENLLALARDGEEIRSQDEVDLDEIVEECWEHVQTADATLNVDVSLTVLADPGRLQQLLENLVRNAVEHGGTEVTVTVGELQDGFYVEDDGSGIPPEQCSKLFDSDTATADEGSGLGLSIVERVADAHGWSVEATTGDEGGARFEITNVEVPVDDEASEPT